MPWFTIQGFDSLGQPVQADEFGESEADVIGRLIGSGVSVVRIQPKGATTYSIDLRRFFQWIPTQELKYFYVNLATLIDAGCTLRSSLASLAEQAENPAMARVLNDINSNIASGKSFSEALALHSNVFNSLFVNLVKAGEEGGMLDKILLQYADYTENQEKIKSKVRGALVLPTIMVLVAGGVVAGLLAYVFPTFMELFKGKEDQLPAPTRLVMAVSDFLRFHYVSLLVYVSCAILATTIFLRTSFGWRVFSYFQLRVPLFGSLFRKVYISRFAHTLGALNKGGVPMLRALKITTGTIPNVEVQDVVEQIHTSVERGGSLMAPMQQNRRLFPSMVTLMVHVGETTGNIDHMLGKVGDYYDAEVQESINLILVSIEPILTVIMGCVVLTIALSMFLPLFNITKLLK